MRTFFEHVYKGVCYTIANWEVFKDIDYRHSAVYIKNTACVLIVVMIP